MEIISRAEAKAKGLKRYFTGTPCKHGHVSERYTRNYECIECSKSSIAKSIKKAKKENLSKQSKQIHPSRRSNKRKTSCKTGIDASPPKSSIEKSIWIEAKENGSIAYYTGSPCWHGHTARRSVETHACLECLEMPLGSINSKPDQAKSSSPGTRGVRRIPLTTSQKEASSRARHHLGKVKSTDKRGNAYHFDYEISEDVLGYTHEQLHSHLGGLRQGWAEYSNKGRWHVDHIIPVAELVRRDVTSPAVINSLHNLQLLTTRQNQKKSDSVHNLSEAEIQSFIQSETTKHRSRMLWAENLAESIRSVMSENGIEFDVDEKKLKYACSWHNDSRKIIPPKPDINFWRSYIRNINLSSFDGTGRKKAELIRVVSEALGESLPSSAAAYNNWENTVSNRDPKKSRESNNWVWVLVVIFLVFWFLGSR